MDGVGLLTTVRRISSSRVIEGRAIAGEFWATLEVGDIACVPVPEFVLEAPGPGVAALGAEAGGLVAGAELFWNGLGLIGGGSGTVASGRLGLGKITGGCLLTFGAGW